MILALQAVGWDRLAVPPPHPSTKTMTQELRVEIEEDLSHSETEQDTEEIIEIEDSLAGRRAQLKDLRNQLLGARRALKSATKATKKELQGRVDDLEKSMEGLKCTLEAEERQAAGAAAVMACTNEQARRDAQRAKKAAKKELKAQKVEQERLDAELSAQLMPQLGKLERQSIGELLLEHGFELHEIEPDGNCLFSALVHQSYVRHGIITTPHELRSQAAAFIGQNADRYAGFLEEPLEGYCAKISGSDLWGGHLELDALSSALQIPIVVYQADAAPIKFGDESFSASPLRICFQKYVYSLGEHYDSLVDRPLPEPPAAAIDAQKTGFASEEDLDIYT